jgi:hypothetical protein
VKTKIKGRLQHVKEEIYIRSIERFISLYRINARSVGCKRSKRYTGANGVHSVCLHQPSEHLSDHFSKRNGNGVWVCAKNTCREKHFSHVYFAAFF